MLPHTHDIYDNPQYASLFLKGSDELFNYSFQKGNEWLSNLAIKRRISSVAGIDIQEELYDLETPYGYGGFQTNSTDPAFLSQAWLDYKSTCQSNKIVAEFIRCHPFGNIPSELTAQWQLYILDRETVYIDLASDYATLSSNYKRSLRGSLSKAKKSNLTFHDITKNPASEAEFERLYDLTMQKNQATDFYYFDHTHFQQLFQLDQVKLYSANLDGLPISMALTFVTDSFIHYHLGASSPEHYSFCGNPYLLDQISKLHAGSGKKFHLGGGRTNHEDDQLLKFKSNFSSQRLPFHIAGIVYNQNKYDHLNHLKTQHSQTTTPGFFLKYRLP